MAKVQIKLAAIPRAGYDYQDLAGIEVLIHQYRDPELYAWVQFEADDTSYRALDDVVAARKWILDALDERGKHDVRLRDKAEFS